MDMTKYVKSKFLKATEYQLGTRLKYRIERRDEVDFDAGPKPSLFFRNEERPLLLNQTQVGSLMELFGKDDEEWIGKKVELQVIPASFKGKPTQTFLIGPATAPAPVVTQADDDDDATDVSNDIPW
jgi:hypothetical protein